MAARQAALCGHGRTIAQRARRIACAAGRRMAGRGAALTSAVANTTHRHDADAQARNGWLSTTSTARVQPVDNWMAMFRSDPRSAACSMACWTAPARRRRSTTLPHTAH
ncbi:MAG: hypothetical protein ABW002_09085 [Xanthomonas sp.]